MSKFSLRIGESPSNCFKGIEYAAVINPLSGACAVRVAGMKDTPKGLISGVAGLIDATSKAGCFSFANGQCATTNARTGEITIAITKANLKAAPTFMQSFMARTPANLAKTSCELYLKALYRVSL